MGRSSALRGPMRPWSHPETGYPEHSRAHEALSATGGASARPNGQFSFGPWGLTSRLKRPPGPSGGASLHEAPVELHAR
eukprot:8949420-Alexandrium_andersonii.AAC.1